MKHAANVSPLDESTAGSPDKFISLLNRQLKSIGVVVEKAEVKTRASGGPPCFRMAGTSYPDWLAQASVAPETLPYRLSMPAEPNYCNDCTPEFKAQMRLQNACLFPNVVFEEVDEIGEQVLVGVSRNRDVAPDSYTLYSEISKDGELHDA